MTKMIKMSLIAAVAVTGMTSTVCAKPAEEIIKGVDFSGSVEYRMENRTTNNAHTSGENVKVVLGVKTPVNDKVTFDAVALVNSQATAATDATANTQGAPSINVAKFTYNAGFANIVAGMQQLDTPWTDAADGARANGVLALIPAGGVTVAAAHFRDSQQGIEATAAINSNDLTALAAIGKAGMVSYQAWYLNINPSSNNTQVLATNALPSGGTALALLVDADFGVAKVNASYASLEGDKSTELAEQTLMKAIVTVPTSAATFVAGIAMGGEDGDLVTFDPDAKVGFQSWNIRAGQSAQADLTAMTVAAVVPIDAVSLKAQYTTAEFDNAKVATTKTEASEMLLEASYAMSKNFTTYLRYAMVDQDVKTVSTGVTANTEIDRVRLSIKYTF